MVAVVEGGGGRGGEGEEIEMEMETEEKEAEELRFPIWPCDVLITDID